MKKNILLIIALCLSIFNIVYISFSLADFVSYDKDSSEQETLQTSDITDLFTSSAKREVMIEGVVFAKNTDCVYVNDDTGIICVKGAYDVNVGDNVLVKGEFLKVGNVPTISYATFESSANVVKAYAPTLTTLAKITALKNEMSSFGKYYTVEGTIKYNSTTSEYTINDTDGENDYSIIIDKKSNDEAFASWVDKKVRANVLITNYVNSVWTVGYFGLDIDVKYPQVEINTIKDDVFADAATKINADADNKLAVYGLLDLPTDYTKLPAINYNWSVVSTTTALTITDNVATVSRTLLNDEVVTIKLEISSYEQTASQEFEVTVKAIQNLSIADIYSGTYADNENIITEGVVVLKTQDYEKKNYTLILTDSNYTAFIRLDVTKKIYNSLSLGDTVKTFCKYYSASVSRIVALTCEKQNEIAGTVDYARVKALAVDMTEKATYTNIAKDVAANNNGVELLKITNPYLQASGKTAGQYSWIRFAVAGSNETKSTYTNDVDTNARTFGFAIPTMVSGLEAELDAPLSNEVSKQYNGYTFYVFIIYTGNTTYQGDLSDANFIERDYKSIVENSLTNAFANYSELDGSVDGSILLPNKVTIDKDYAITWSADKNNIDLTDGSYTKVTNDTVVKLTASYTINDTPYTWDFEIKLVAELVYQTVSEVLTAGEQNVSAMKGNIVGVVPGHGGSSTLSKLYITDGKKVVALSAGDYAGLTFGYYTVTLDGTALKVGDTIQMTALTLNNQDLLLTADSKVEIIASEILTTSFDGATVIDSDEDLVNYVATINASSSATTYGLIKLEGTKENPLYLTNKNKYFQYIYFDATHSSNKISDNTNSYIMGWHTGSVAYMDSDWTINNTPMTNVEGATSYSDYSYVSTEIDMLYGSCYLIFEYCPATTSNYKYIYHGVLSQGFDLTKMTEAEIAYYEVSKLVIGDLAVGGKLPTSTDSIDALTWECSDASITINADGTYTQVTAEKIADLTAKWVVGESNYQYTFNNVKFTAAAKEYLTVSQALASEATSLDIKAVVGGFGAQATSGEGAGYNKGIILTDGTSVMIVDDGALTRNTTDKCYYIGEHKIVIGDEIIIEDGKKSGVSITEGTLSLSQEGQTVSWVTWANDAEGYTTIDSEADLTAWASTAKVGDIIKVVGTTENPFFFGGSGTGNGGNGCNYKLHFKNTTSTKSADAKYTCSDSTARIIAFKGGSNEWVAGSSWWTSLGMPEGGFVGPGSANVANKYGFTGTFYALYTEQGGSNMNMVFINPAEWNITALVK